MDFLENLWDKATGVFGKWADFELSRYELDLANRRLAHKWAQEQARQPASSGWAPVGPAVTGTLPSWALPAALVGAGAFLLLRR